MIEQVLLVGETLLVVFFFSIVALVGVVFAADLKRWFDRRRSRGG